MEGARGERQSDLDDHLFEKVDDDTLAAIETEGRALLCFIEDDAETFDIRFTEYD